MAFQIPFVMFLKTIYAFSNVVFVVVLQASYGGIKARISLCLFWRI